MEKVNFILMLFFSLFVAKGQAQTDITASFTDLNFRAAVYEKIDKTAPAPIYDTDVVAVEWLHVQNKNISSMNGIEHFINLTILVCNENRISTLDLSNSTKLEFLECIDNQLTSLNVSKLTDLRYLHCEINQLTTLDVSNLINMFEFYCRDNKLSNLDVSNLKGILEIDCGINQLSTLDVSNLTTLKGLYCFDNNLTTLDVRGLNQLETINWMLNYLKADPVGYDPSITTEYYFDPQKTKTAIPDVSPDKTTVLLLAGNILSVDSQENETVSLYSLSGSLLYSTKKPAGEVQISLGDIQEKTLIVRGSSGWVKKSVRK